MAVTAQTIINGALRLIGKLEEGETPSPETSEDSLQALNDMIESWDLERLMVYQILEETFSLTSGTASYTIGSSGTWNTTRPIRIERSTFIRDTRSSPNLDYPLTIIYNDQWDAISQKSLQSTFPQYIYYDAQFPLGVVYLWPITNVTGISLYLNSLKQLQTFASVTTAVSLPLGYNRAMRFNLARELAGEFGVDAPDDVKEVATDSKRNLKSINQDQQILAIPQYLAGRSGQRYNIYTGEGR